MGFVAAVASESMVGRNPQILAAPGRPQLSGKVSEGRPRCRFSQKKEKEKKWSRHGMAWQGMEQ